MRVYWMCWFKCVCEGIPEWRTERVKYRRRHFASLSKRSVVQRMCQTGNAANRMAWNIRTNVKLTLLFPKSQFLYSFFCMIHTKWNGWTMFLHFLLEIVVITQIFLEFTLRMTFELSGEENMLPIVFIDFDYYYHGQRNLWGHISKKILVRFGWDFGTTCSSILNVSFQLPFGMFWISESLGVTSNDWYKRSLNWRINIVYQAKHELCLARPYQTQNSKLRLTVAQVWLVCCRNGIQCI